MGWLREAKVRTLPVGAVQVICGSLELLAVLRQHADLLPYPVLVEMAAFTSTVEEHVEVVE